jgi:hypothetical protein
MFNLTKIFRRCMFLNMVMFTYLGVRFLAGIRFFFSPQCPDRFWGLLRLLFNGCGGEIKCHGCEADHSPPTSAEVKNGGAISPCQHMYLWCGA